MLRDAMAPRKRAEGRRNPRLTIEIYPDDAQLVQEMRIAAVRQGVTLREWVLGVCAAALDMSRSDDGEHDDDAHVPA